MKRLIFICTGIAVVAGMVTIALKPANPVPVQMYHVDFEKVSNALGQRH